MSPLAPGRNQAAAQEADVRTYSPSLPVYPLDQHLQYKSCVEVWTERAKTSLTFSKTGEKLSPDQICTIVLKDRSAEPETLDRMGILRLVTGGRPKMEPSEKVTPSRDDQPSEFSGNLKDVKKFWGIRDTAPAPANE